MTKAIDSTDYCQFLDWDSRFFQRRIARATICQLDVEIVSRILRWCEMNHIDCLYFLADSIDRQTSLIVRNNDFNFVDIRVTLNTHLHMDKCVGNKMLPHILRTSRSEDISTLREIAIDSFQLSRFYFDGNFPREDCDALYLTWVEKSCQGYADTVLVVETEEQVAGFITCVLDSEHTGSIGLVGVDKKFRGKGVGRLLVSSSLEWFANRSIKEVNVVTQGRNIVALRLYESSGFLIKSVQIWYHKWFSQSQ